jgi:hypothetical protein
MPCKKIADGKCNNRRKRGFLTLNGQNIDASRKTLCSRRYAVAREE